MSNKNKNRSKETGYKPVDCQELEKEINGDSKPSPVTPVILPKPENSFRVVGSCRLSKTGQSLAIKLNATDKHPESFVNISRKTLISLFNDENALSVGNVIEYDNSHKIQVIGE